MIIEDMLELASVLMIFLAALAGASCVIPIGPRGIRRLLVLLCCAIALCLLPEPINPLHYWLMHMPIDMPSDPLPVPVRYNGIVHGMAQLFI
ncbi:MAG: hypothetical protein JWQ10_1237 [Herbaspirillum sp.]|jgi:hypothetical protein|nr:hypothetical protein [Herbaspirillum sp.]